MRTAKLMAMCMVSAFGIIVAAHEARGCEPQIVAPQVFVQPQVLVQPHAATSALLFTPSVVVVPSVSSPAVCAFPSTLLPVQSLAAPAIVRQKVVVRAPRPVFSVQRTFTRTRSR